ncbi:ankyrin repeat-containing domain protein [Colletotrichum godetiae]|uniref:Ankyrin repeat-containing domain protein n=1 Tax=Colletotrichum godetiae TaxID=1209918 RepID=A0AAJ0EXN5_9PEZI|nr:ankyrin repeat-containing domain protein [Colletotrichum godetiae]KAK1691284.1 ankyrin repeat-containing domain protein [Colletotrichum godetiae]
MLESLLQLGVPLDKFDTQAETALHIAAHRGCGRICIRILLAESANRDVESRLGWTPLMIAARYGHLEAITELIRGDARLDRRGFHGWTALHVASQNGREEAFKLLVGAGASLGIVDNDGLKANDAPVGRVNLHFPCQRLERQHRPLVSLGIPLP